MEIPNRQSHERLRSWVSLALAESCIDLLVVRQPLGNFLVAIIFLVFTQHNAAKISLSVTG